MEAMPMTAKSYICWFKGDQSSQSHMSQKGRFYPAWEPIYHFSESDIPLRETQINDHWEIRAAVGGTSDSKAAGEHPAPYPVELPKRAIESTCPNDAVILDPFMGSGTTAVAAVEYGCDYVGFELDEEGAYKPIIERRIGEAKRQREAGVNQED
jgi:DNA modification methylase